MKLDRNSTIKILKNENRCNSNMQLRKCQENQNKLEHLQIHNKTKKNILTRLKFTIFKNKRTFTLLKSVHKIATIPAKNNLLI